MCLFDEIDEGLGLNETLEKWLILSHVLHIVLKVENVVGAVASQASHV